MLLRSLRILAVSRTRAFRSMENPKIPGFTEVAFQRARVNDVSCASSSLDGGGTFRNSFSFSVSRSICVCRSSS
jgi:hypothetical protein